MHAVVSEKNTSHSSELLDENLRTKPFTSKLRFVGKGTEQPKASKQRTLQTMELKATHQQLMDRVKCFLPKIDSANKTLNLELATDGKAQDRLDIENVDDCNEVVEMNIAMVRDLQETAVQQLLEEVGSDSSSDEDDSENESIAELKTSS